MALGSAAARRVSPQPCLGRWGWCQRERGPVSPDAFQVKVCEFWRGVLCPRNELKKLNQGWVRLFYLWY